MAALPVPPPQEAEDTGGAASSGAALPPPPLPPAAHDSDADPVILLAPAGPASSGLADPRLLGGLVIRFKVNPDLLLLFIVIQGPEKTWVDQLVWEQIELVGRSDQQYSRKEAASTSNNPLSSTFS